MNRGRIKDTKDGKNYVYAIKAMANTYGLEEDTPTVTVFLHTQTTYIKSLNTYVRVNIAIQHAAEHLALT